VRWKPIVVQEAALSADAAVRLRLPSPVAPLVVTGGYPPLSGTGTPDAVANVAAARTYWLRVAHL